MKNWHKTNFPCIFPFVVPRFNATKKRKKRKRNEKSKNYHVCSIIVPIYTEATQNRIYTTDRNSCSCFLFASFHSKSSIKNNEKSPSHQENMNPKNEFKMEMMP